VEILPRGNEEPEANARWAHIAVATSDARKAYSLALEAGAMSRNEPRDILLAGMPASNALVAGPDGEGIEFFQLK
jgi:hypothetical protein